MRHLLFFVIFLFGLWLLFMLRRRDQREKSFRDMRTTPQPYAYPTTPHVRRHGPGGWSDYQKYRPWLRDEFAFRCVYCLEREVWRDMRQKMHIDHFEPQVLRKDLRCEYTNLLYLCPACNSEKSDSLLPDPCEIALADCLRVHRNGNVEALNKAGESLIDVLALDHPLTVERRRRMIGTLLSLSQSDWLMFVEWMRYPRDMPDLNDPKNTPRTNSKPEGIAQSYYARKLRGDLPEVY